MQFPSSLMNNVKVLDVASLKTQQEPASDNLKAIARDHLNAPEQRLSATEQVEMIYDHLERFAQSTGGIDASKLAAGKERSLANIKFQEENGYTQQATQNLKNLYHQAESGDINGRGLDDKEDAISYISRTLAQLQNAVGTINRLGEGDIALDGAYDGRTFEPVEGYDEYNKWLEQHVASSKDALEASRMKLVVESEMLAKTFGIDEPIFEVKDGQVQIRSFDMTYKGETIAHSAGGAMVEYGENGTLKMDKKV